MGDVEKLVAKGHQEAAGENTKQKERKKMDAAHVAAAHAAHKEVRDEYQDSVDSDGDDGARAISRSWLYERANEGKHAVERVPGIERKDEGDERLASGAH